MNDQLKINCLRNSMIVTYMLHIKCLLSIILAKVCYTEISNMNFCNVEYGKVIYGHLL